MAGGPSQFKFRVATKTENFETHRCYVVVGLERPELSEPVPRPPQADVFVISGIVPGLCRPVVASFQPRSFSRHRALEAGGEAAGHSASAAGLFRRCAGAARRQPRPRARGQEEQ